MLSNDQLMSLLDARSVDCAILHRTDGPGFSKLGGKPNLPDNVDWPDWNGAPMSFIAQLRLSDVQRVAPIEWLPTVGQLWFFYDQDQSTWGFDPNDLGSWAVIYVNEERDASRREFPSALQPEARFTEVFVEARPHRSLPSPARLEIGSDEIDESFWDAFDSINDAFLPHHQLGGYPSAIQSENMEMDCQLASNGIYLGDGDGYQGDSATALKAGSADWRLLLQIDSDDDAGMMWGDLGRLYFWVRAQDLAARDFSKTWLVLQCS